MNVYIHIHVCMHIYIKTIMLLAILNAHVREVPLNTYLLLYIDTCGHNRYTTSNNEQRHKTICRVTACT